jgi:hypothetical protein
MKSKSEINYHERSHYYSTKYMRSSKAVGVLWGIFTMCYTILAIVVFMQVGFWPVLSSLWYFMQLTNQSTE